jgi:hypothetical protein
VMSWAALSILPDLNSTTEPDGREKKHISDCLTKPETHHAQVKDTIHFQLQLLN